MPRKFLYTLHALVENYSSNQVTHLMSSSGFDWTVVGNITAGPSSNNLSALASNLQGSRVLYANYSGGGVVPLDYNGSTWVPGTLVPQGGGNCAAVAMSDDGLHALSGGDYSSGVTPYNFNTGTGLWEASSVVSIPSAHFNSVSMTRDGSRAITVPKWDPFVFPLARDPGTGDWTVGSGIGLTGSTEKFFCSGISPSGDAAIVGSCYNPLESTALTWNGTTWDHVTIPVVLRSACWRPDGLSAIGGGGESEAGVIRTVNFDPITKAFTLGQTLTGFNTIVSVTVANDGTGDTALAADFYANTVIPLTYSRMTGLWTAGSPIVSGLFSNPWNMLVFPIW
jgi:hypothetical protein